MSLSLSLTRSLSLSHPLSYPLSSHSLPLTFTLSPPNTRSLARPPLTVARPLSVRAARELVQRRREPVNTAATIDDRARNRARKNHDVAADAPYARDDQRFGDSGLRQVGPGRLLRAAGMRPDVHGELAQNDKLRVHVNVCAHTYSGRKSDPNQSRYMRCDNWLNVLNET